MELESEYYDELTKIEELQVFQSFIKWALEQENLVWQRRCRYYRMALSIGHIKAAGGQ